MKTLRFRDAKEKKDGLDRYIDLTIFENITHCVLIRNRTSRLTPIYVSTDFSQIHR